MSALIVRGLSLVLGVAVDTQKRKSCFVISPIGPDDSEVRKFADDFLELLVEPALAPFNFEVIRADKIARPTIITSDIISLVQQADLCVIDLTGHNANVYYECGRRHEAGLPFIQLIRKGEELPFDVAGIRTIHYDLSDPRSTLASVKEVQGFVHAIESEGYSESSSGESLASISDSIRRIERKLNSALSSSGASATRVGAPSTSKSFDYLLEHPRVAFMKALEAGDLAAAASLIPRIKKLLGPVATADAAAYLARAGEQIGKATLLELLENFEEIPYDALALSTFGLKEYYYNTDREEEGIVFFENLVSKLSRSKAIDENQLAVAINQMQMLRYSIGDYDGAEKDLIRVIAIAPADPVYRYNLVTVYDRQGRLEDAVTAVDSLIKFESLKEDHVRKAISVYREAGREEDAIAAEAKLREIITSASEEESN